MCSEWSVNACIGDVAETGRAAVWANGCLTGVGLGSMLV